MKPTTVRVVLSAEGCQPEVNAVLTEIVEGYRGDAIETLEGIRTTLASINGAFEILELPPAFDLQLMSLRLDLALGKINKYLRAKRALDCLEAA